VAIDWVHPALNVVASYHRIRDTVLIVPRSAVPAGSAKASTRLKRLTKWLVARNAVYLTLPVNASALPVALDLAFRVLNAASLLILPLDFAPTAAASSRQRKLIVNNNQGI